MTYNDLLLQQGCTVDATSVASVCACASLSLRVRAPLWVYVFICLFLPQCVSACMLRLSVSLCLCISVCLRVRWCTYAPQSAFVRVCLEFLLPAFLARSLTPPRSLAQPICVISLANCKLRMQGVVLSNIPDLAAIPRS